MPVVYLMEVEDSARTALPKDTSRWPAAQAHLLAQSVGGLKLLTIAKGFDTDFPDLHPKRLRRLYLGLRRRLRRRCLRPDWRLRGGRWL